MNQDLTGRDSAQHRVPHEDLRDLLRDFEAMREVKLVENADPHQPPIRTPQNDEPPVDPNPSVFAGCVARTPPVTLH